MAPKRKLGLCWGMFMDMSVADFISALQRANPAGGPLPGAQNSYRGAPLARRDRETRVWIAALKSAFDRFLENGGSPEFANYVESEGALLHTFAVYCVLDEEIHRPQHHVSQCLSDETCGGWALALGARRCSPLPRRPPVKQRPRQQIDSDE